jgi:2,4-dienoyl-CoA reductase-like NADH-dependent reductase (Old Yellow Enzyme family)
MRLLEPLRLGPVEAANRVVFGPHVTNLGDDDRRFTTRHVAYYARRSSGGCGIIVTEGASVHDSDWPYERAPLASRCAGGWNEIAEACHAHRSLVVASLDHAGGQGSSAYNQLPLWAPSRVPEVNTRETPKWMEPTTRARWSRHSARQRRSPSCRLRRRRDQRRATQPGAPVHVGPPTTVKTRASGGQRRCAR